MPAASVLELRQMVRQCVGAVIAEQYARKNAPGQRSLFGGEKLASDKTQGQFRWVTIGGEPGEKGEHEGGTPIKIEKATGAIVAGPKALAEKGIKKVSDFGKSESERQQQGSKGDDSDSGPAKTGPGVDEKRQPAGAVGADESTERTPPAKTHDPYAAALSEVKAAVEAADMGTAAGELEAMRRVVDIGKKHGVSANELWREATWSANHRDIEAEVSGEADERAAERPLHSNMQSVKAIGDHAEKLKQQRDEAAKKLPQEQVDAIKEGRIKMVQAPAGGAVSDVNGKFYKGGHWMPVHGLSAGQSQPEQKPKAKNGGSPPIANPNGKAPTAREMSPEQVATEKERRETQERWNKLNAGPLAKAGKWLGDSPNHKAITDDRIGLKEWQSWASEAGPDGVKRLIADIEPQVHAAIDAEGKAHRDEWEKTGGNGFGRAPQTDDDQWAKDQLKRQADDALKSQPRINGKHEKEVPGSHYARELVSQMMQQHKSIEGLEKVSDAMARATSQPTAAANQQDAEVGTPASSGQAGASVKSPWEQTRDEFLPTLLPRKEGHPHELTAKQFAHNAMRDQAEKQESYTPQGQPYFNPTFTQRKAEKQHRQSVADAIASGKTVAPEVLKDYPELAKPTPDTVEQTATRHQPAASGGSSSSAPALPSRESDYFKGDRVEFTGKTTPEGFREFEFMEGHRKGQLGVMPTNAQKDAAAAKRQSEWADQQQQFKRLHEPETPSRESVVKDIAEKVAEKLGVEPTAKQSGSSESSPTTPAKAQTLRDDGSLLGMDAPKPNETPRQTADRQQKAIDADYEFARESKIRNAGEDLKGSARHKRNAWRGLEAAEADGSAVEMVTRDNLLKAEPHNLMTAAEKNPLTALAMHYAMRSFPAKPGYGKQTVTAHVRREYHEAYQLLKVKADDLALTESDPKAAIERLRHVVSEHIKSLRSTSTTGRYNQTANALVSTWDALATFYPKKTTALGKLNEFSQQLAAAYGTTPDAKAAAASEYMGNMQKHAQDIIEGMSLPESFNKKGEGKKRAAEFNPADLYVKHAKRQGGRDVSHLTSSPDKATENVLKTFGSRGVQWGNSVTDDEREHHASKLVEALADLADVTGLKPEDIGLGGRMGWAIGARGHGRASAHYEPSTQVINLTRASGVGALAHEWGHAFDHAMKDFGISRDGADYASENISPERFETDEKGNIKTYQDERGRTRGKTINLSDDPMWKGFDGVRKAWKDSGYQYRLKTALNRMVDKGAMSEKRAKEYWDSTREKFARTFERHVQHKLRADNRDNTYLTGMGDVGDDSLWPTDAEAAKIAPAFDALLAAYRKKKYGDEAPQKYSRRDLQGMVRYAIGNAVKERYSATANGGRLSESPPITRAETNHLSAAVSKERLRLRDRIASAASQTDRNPTDDQKKAGNYRKGKFWMWGHEVAIENPKGSTRSGTDSSGKAWSVTMGAHYGYVRRTLSKADGDAVDCFIGPHPESEVVFVVNQRKPSGKFDEHKCVIGCRSIGEAKNLYLSCYLAGWQGMQSIVPMTKPQFLKWLERGDTTRAVKFNDSIERYDRSSDLAAKLERMGLKPTPGMVSAFEKAYERRKLKDMGQEIPEHLKQGRPFAEALAETPAAKAQAAKEAEKQARQAAKQAKKAPQPKPQEPVVSVPAKPKRQPGDGTPGWQRVGGAPVFVDGNGKIIKGCPGLKGEHVSDLIDESDDSRKRREVRNDHALAMGKDGKDFTPSQLKKLETGRNRERHEAAQKAAKKAGVPTHKVLSQMPEIEKTARSMGVKRTDAADALGDALRAIGDQYEIERMNAKEVAKAHKLAMRLTGLTPAKIHKLEDSGKDHTAVRGFDVNAYTFAAENESPFVHFDKHSGDIEQQVWEFIKNGKPEKPTLSKVASNAADMLANNIKQRLRKAGVAVAPAEDHSDEWAAMERREPSLNEDRLPGDEDEVPEHHKHVSPDDEPFDKFSRRAALSIMGKLA